MGLDVMENLTSVCDKCHGLLELRPFGPRANIIMDPINNLIEMLKIKAKVSKMGDKIHIIIPKSYHQDIEKYNLLNQFVDIEIIGPED
jgi:hypothetical protein